MFKTCLALTTITTAIAIAQLPARMAAAHPSTKITGIVEAGTVQTVDDFGIHDADAAATAAIHNAMDRFAEAGLELPELRIHVHEGTEGCNGSFGLFSKGGDLHRLDICDLRVIVHEMAHAWEHHFMTDATRQAFMEQQGVDSWNDSDTVYNHRGIERVAFVISWGLDANPIQPHLTDHHAADLDAYELLTGTTTPRLVADEGDHDHHPRPVVEIDIDEIDAVTNFE